MMSPEELARHIGAIVDDLRGPNHKGEWRGRCPACQKLDKLTIKENGFTGRAWISCWAGCDWRDILRTADLTPADVNGDKTAGFDNRGALRASRANVGDRKREPFRTEPGLPLLAIGKAHELAGGTGEGKSLAVLVGLVDAVLASGPPGLSTRSRERHRGVRRSA